MPYRMNKWFRPKGYRENLAKEKQKQRQGHTALNVCSERSDSNQVTDVAIADDVDFTFAHLQQNISQVKLPSGWTPRTSPARLMISQLECTDEDMKVSRTVTISDDLHWKVKIHGHDIPNTHPAFNDTSTVIDSFEMLEKLLALISDCNICCGNPEQTFVELLQSKGGEIVKAISFAGEKEVSAYLEGDFNATSLDGTSYHHTVRTSKCSLITDKNRCTECCKYRNNLRSLVSRRKSDNLGDENKTHSSSRTNLRYLTNQQLQQRAKNLHNELVSTKLSLSRMARRAIVEDGIKVDKELERDIQYLMEDNAEEVTKRYGEDSFQRLFWEEQLKYARCADNPRQMRWHPTILRWCLFLKFKSSAGYDALRESGFIKLPSQRTLCDYSNYIKPQPGITHAVMKEITAEINAQGVPDDRRYVVLLHDEIKIKRDLVYDKYTGQLIGFINLGDINEELVQLERRCNGTDDTTSDIASHILVLMVRGLAFKLESSLCYFPTDGCRSDHLFPIIWSAIAYLEMSCGLKVLASTSDGASWNRKFYRMHRVYGAPRDTLVFKTKNAASADERFIYFISDVPHLVKTARNCWAHSEAHRQTRSLWNGNPIVWRHLTNLVVEDRARDIHLLHKLGYEHISLTSFSVMRVNLAAQVLSETVANAIEAFGPPEATETAKFVRYMDKFFDCLNVRNRGEHVQKRKPNLAPYTDVNDPRLEWLQNDFLGYFANWEAAVRTRPGEYTKSQRDRMMLSWQTLEGLRMTVNSFVEITKYLLRHGVEYVLSEKLCQDPLEAHFSKHRHRGGANNDPTVQAFGYQENAIRLQRSHHLQSITGNTGRYRRQREEVIDNTPLPKRPRTSNQ